MSWLFSPSNDPNDSPIASARPPLRSAAAVWGHVLPEERVQDVSRDVERETLLQPIERGEVLLLPRLGQLVECRVRTGDEGRVMLAVVQL